MHKHTVDWLRQINLTGDVTLAEKRWGTAEKIAKKLTQRRVIELLRLFLFPSSTGGFSHQFTEELVDLDADFPVTGNTQELRLIAGLVIISKLDKPSNEADAFALGIRSANFPKGRSSPIQPEMVSETELYLQKESNRVRPDDFSNDGTQVTKRLAARVKAASEADASEDVSKQNTANQAFRDIVTETILDSHSKLAVRAQQLAEEISLLWWVFSEYSETLSAPTSKLTQESYAFVVATEAAKRTHILPPPPSIGPLLSRALRNCKAGKKKRKLQDYFEETNPVWRASFLQSNTPMACRDLVAISTGIEKMEELGDSTSAFKALEKLCPGVPPDLIIAPDIVASQLYAEIAFLNALAAVDTE